MKNVIQAKAKENLSANGGDKKSVAAKSDSQKSDEAIFEPRRKRNKQRLLGGLIPSFYRFLKKLNQSTPTKNCPGINLESAQNAQIPKVASGQNDAMPNRTRDIVAQNHSIGTKTVERAAQFS